MYETYWQHFNDNAFWHTKPSPDDDVHDLFLEDFLKAKLKPAVVEKSELPLFDIYQGDYLEKLKEDLEPDEIIVDREFKELQGYSGVYQKIGACPDIDCSLVECPMDPMWFYKFLATGV